MINLYNGDYLDNQSILDYASMKNEMGYIIKDNIDMIIHIANRDIISNACSIEFFYYDTLNNRNIKIRTKDSYYLFDSVINVVPDHAYTYLQNINKLTGKIFVVKINYEKRVNESINTSTDSDIIPISNDNYKIGHFSKYFYFKLLSDDEYLAYKKLKDEADSFTIVKDGPISVKRKK